MNLLELLATTKAPVVADLTAAAPATDAWNNQPTWDNTGTTFDNRPTWDNWTK
ncbi:multiple cyclophane-containing RiPP AmcA [Streptomyces sp. NPDC004031]